MNMEKVIEKVFRVSLYAWVLMFGWWLGQLRVNQVVVKVPSEAAGVVYRDSVILDFSRRAILLPIIPKSPFSEMA